MTDIVLLRRSLEGRAREVAEHLLPRGVRDGQEWCVGSTAGEPGKSLKVRVKGSKVGTRADFAANGESGDLIDLWQAVKRCSLPEALKQIRAWLGISEPTFEGRSRKTYRRPEKPRCNAPKSAVKEYLTG